MMRPGKGVTARPPYAWRGTRRTFPVDLSSRRHTVWVSTRFPPTARRARSQPKGVAGVTAYNSMVSNGQSWRLFRRHLSYCARMKSLFPIRARTAFIGGLATPFLLQSVKSTRECNSEKKWPVLNAWRIRFEPAVEFVETFITRCCTFRVPLPRLGRSSSLGLLSGEISLDC